MPPEGTAVDRSSQGDDQRRAQLLEAAGRVFHRAPAGGLTLAAVAEEAGVSRRLMYHYFADLQALYDELFDARILNHVHGFDAELAETLPTSTPAMLAMAVRRFIKLPGDYRRWTLMACTDTLPAELAAQRDLMFEAVRQRWARFDFFATLDPDTQRTVMSMIVANICLLSTAVESGHLTSDQATDIAVTTITTIARTAHDATHAMQTQERP